MRIEVTPLAESARWTSLGADTKRWRLLLAAERVFAADGFGAPVSASARSS